MWTASAAPPPSHRETDSAHREPQQEVGERKETKVLGMNSLQGVCKLAAPMRESQSARPPLTSLVLDVFLPLAHMFANSSVYLNLSATWRIDSKRVRLERGTS